MVPKCDTCGKKGLGIVEYSRQVALGVTPGGNLGSITGGRA